MKVGVMVALVASGAVARAQTPATGHEGRISVTRGTIGGRSQSGAEAIFIAAPILGDVIASDGPCKLYRHIVAPKLSAGTITITGTVAPITLEEATATRDIYYRRVGAVPDPAFVAGATITVAASGGTDLPAFTATVTAPAELLGYVPPTALSRSGYTATWTPGAGPEIMIAVAASDARMQKGAAVVCRVPDTGRFTVPASTFALFPRGADRAIILVGRLAETVQTVADTRVMIEAISSVGSGPFMLAPPHVETSPRKFFSVGAGFGGVSRVGDAPPTGGESWRIQFGQRLAHGLHLVEELDDVGDASLSDVSTDNTSFGVGIRWTPIEPRPVPTRGLYFTPFPGTYFDPKALYLTAIVGVNLRERLSATQPTDDAWSPMASVALGLTPVQGRDWSLGYEFREQLARYDGHLQRGWQLLFVINLNDW